MRILILGGTQEAYEAANMLHDLGHQVITSLSGATKNPKKPKGKINTGGFGGPDGLATYIETNDIDYLIDATHPFAAKMSAGAVICAQKSKIPLIRLIRAPFIEPEGANWWHVDSNKAAAEKLPSGATVFLSIGRQGLTPFFSRSDIRFLVRSIEPPTENLPENFRAFKGRPPFTRSDEISLLKREGITHLVSKNSGGEQTRAKLEAAFMLRVQVIMISRPPLPPAREVETVEELKEVFVQLPPSAGRSFFLPLLRRMWAKLRS